MAAMAKPLSFFVILLIVNSLFFIETAEARPFNIMKSRNSAASRAVESFFDGLSLGEIKQSGPSPGVGNSFTSSQTLGGIKDGPAPCCGNKYTTGISLTHVQAQQIMKNLPRCFLARHRSLPIATCLFDLMVCVRKFAVHIDAINITCMDSSSILHYLTHFLLQQSISFISHVTYHGSHGQTSQLLFHSFHCELPFLHRDG
uniref:Prolamin-like domain-containing protein n=1 Tax=Salix viminalis TaxID=40686 RepID=A0A6N2LE64_SALVM